MLDIDAYEMLCDTNMHEEKFTENLPARDLARLSLYRLPMDIYAACNSESSLLSDTLYYVWWFECPTSYDSVEFQHAFTQRFLIGEDRRAAACLCRCYGLGYVLEVPGYANPIIGEIKFRKYALYMERETGLLAGLEAYLAGVPIDDIWPDCIPACHW